MSLLDLVQDLLSSFVGLILLLVVQKACYTLDSIDSGKRLTLSEVLPSGANILHLHVRLHEPETWSAKGRTLLWTYVNSLEQPSIVSGTQKWPGDLLYDTE